MVPQTYLSYVDWLRTNVPHAYENLAPPATDPELDSLEEHLGHALPAPVRAVLGVHNGQRATMTASRHTYAIPCLPTLSFLSTSLIAECWSDFAAVRNDPEFSEEDDNIGYALPSSKGLVKPLYTSAGWIPLWSDPFRADYIGLDLDPDTSGTPGQIINFGRNEDRHFVCAHDFTELLSILLEEVQEGAWPASYISAEDGERPWFGDPRDHFFNPLYQRSSRE